LQHPKEPKVFVVGNPVMKKLSTGDVDAIETDDNVGADTAATTAVAIQTMVT